MSELFRDGLKTLERRLRRIARLVLPEFLQAWLRKWLLRRQLTRCARADRERYLWYSGTLTPYARKDSFQALLTMRYHGVERALALPAPRPGFGEEAVKQLVSDLERYVKSFGPDKLAKVVLNVLFAYHNFNLRHALENKELLEHLLGLKELIPDNSKHAAVGGVVSLSREEIQCAGQSVFSEFVQKRSSIRNFADRPVAPELIEEAVRISLKTPSVCNRQAWRVHCFQGKSECGRIMKYQKGNRGFGDSNHVALIVTCELRAFFGVEERNAAFIDGGMFAMSLVYAIHSLGLGSCCLNLSFGTEDELALRAAAGIDENEALILMIVVGHLPEKLLAAQSSRKPVGEILTVHRSGQAVNEAVLDESFAEEQWMREK